MKQRLTLAVGILGVALGVFAEPAAAEKFTVETVMYPGFGPLFIARDKGFFKAHGLDVEIIIGKGASEMYPDLNSGKVQVVTSGAGTSVIYADRPDQYQYVGAFDDSNGADGIVALKTIKSIKDLKGKRIAVAQGQISEFFLLSILKDAGLKESDVTVVNMDSEAAGKAFVSKEVDAAVTWEPWLSKSKATDFGGILIDSTATPGLMSDAMVVTKEYATQHAAALKGFVAGWNEAVAFLADHQQEGIDIIAKDMGGWMKDPKVVAEALETVRFFGAEDQKTLMGSKDNPGPLYQTVKTAIDVWSGVGKVKVKNLVPENFINYGFVGG